MTSERFRATFYKHEPGEYEFQAIPGNSEDKMYAVIVANIQVSCNSYPNNRKNQDTLGPKLQMEELKGSILNKIRACGIPIWSVEKFDKWTPAVHLRIKGDMIHEDAWLKACGPHYDLHLVNPTDEPYTVSVNWVGEAGRFPKHAIGPAFVRLLDALSLDHEECKNVPILGHSVGQSSKSCCTKAWITYHYLGLPVAQVLSRAQGYGLEIGGTTLEPRVKWSAFSLAAHPVLHFTTNLNKRDSHGEVLHWVNFLHHYELNNFPYAFLKTWSGRVCGVLLFPDSMEELSYLVKAWTRKVTTVAGISLGHLTSNIKGKKSSPNKSRKTRAYPTGNPRHPAAQSTRTSSNSWLHKSTTSTRPSLHTERRQDQERGEQTGSERPKTPKPKQSKPSWKSSDQPYPRLG